MLQSLGPLQGCHLLSLSNLCLWRMQQPTWAWQKTCRQRMRNNFSRQMQQPTWMWQKTHLAWFEITQQSSCWQTIGIASSCLSHFCQPFGIATSRSTRYQQTIGVADICVSNSGDVVWIRQSTERWNHVEWKQCIQITLMFYRGRSPQVEWKHCFQLALIFYCSSAHEIENFWTLSQLHVEQSSLISLCRFPFSIATSRSTHFLENFCTLSQLHVELSSLISLCRFPFGIATSRSTHCQQTIGTATSCTLNVKKLVIDEQSLMPL